MAVVVALARIADIANTIVVDIVDMLQAAYIAVVVSVGVVDSFSVLGTVDSDPFAWDFNQGISLICQDYP